MLEETMDKEVSKEVSIDDIQQVKKKLEEEVNEKRIQLDNINAQIHQSRINFETDKKVDVEAGRRQLALLQQKITNKEDSLIGRTNKVEVIENEIKNRMYMLEKREQEVVDLDEDKAKLLKKRGDFLSYKLQVEKELEQAQIMIAEANSKEGMLDKISEGLKYREDGVVAKEKYWNDKIGALEFDLKMFQIEKDNFESLQTKNKEAVNA